MSLPMSAEARYAKIREGVVALSLMQSRGPELLDQGFMMEGQQGGEALDHLRDVLHDISEQHGVPRRLLRPLRWPRHRRRWPRGDRR